MFDYVNDLREDKSGIPIYIITRILTHEDLNNEIATIKSSIKKVNDYISSHPPIEEDDHPFEGFHYEVNIHNID